MRSCPATSRHRPRSRGHRHRPAVDLGRVSPWSSTSRWWSTAGSATAAPCDGVSGRTSGSQRSGCASELPARPASRISLKGFPGGRAAAVMTGPGGFQPTFPEAATTSAGIRRPTRGHRSTICAAPVEPSPGRGLPTGRDDAMEREGRRTPSLERFAFCRAVVEFYQVIEPQTGPEPAECEIRSEHDR